MRLGDLIRIKRKEKDLTVVELSKLTGISRPYLSQLESGTKQNPSDKNIRILADVLGIDQQALELAVEAESSDRISTLREQIRTTQKELDEFREYMSTARTCIDKLEGLAQSFSGESSFYSLEQEDVTRKIEEALDKTHISLEKLRNKQGTLGATMNLLEGSLDIPTWPEPIGNIIREAETLGDDGLRFLEQQIRAIKEFLSDKKSET